MNIGTLTIEMAANVARLSKDMDTARRTVERTFGNIEKDVARLKGLLGGLFAGLSATAVIGKLVDVQRQFDVLNSSLVTVTGSSAAAAKEFAWIKQFAATTPFQLAEVTGAFVKMKALGLDASQAALASYGNTASAMGKSLNQMIEAVADASTGEFERLKEFGIKARQEGDRVTLTFQGVSKNIGNNAAEITAYLQAIGENEFAGAMAQRMNTLDGAISNLSDTWDELFRTISEQQAGNIIYDGVRLAIGAIEDLITIMKALNSATQENASQTGAMKVIQEGIAIVFETVAVLGVNLKYVLVQIGKEIGGIAAQAAAILRGDFAQAGEIRRMMVADAEAARQEVDATTARILNARSAAQAATAANAAMAQSAPPASRAATSVASSTKKANDELEKFITRLNANEAGVESDFYKNLTMLNDAYTNGKISLEEYQALAERYIKSQRFYQDEIKRTNDELDKWFENEEKLRLEKEKAIGSAREMVEQIEFETEALKMTNTEREIAIKLRELERKGIKAGSAEYEEFAQRIRDAVIGKDAVEASIEQQRKAEQEWQKTWDQVGQSFTDALMQGGKSVKDYLISLFRTMVLRPILQPIVGGVLASFGLGGSAYAQGTGGTMSQALGLSNIFTTAKGIYDTVIGGFEALGTRVAFAADEIGAWLVNNTTGVLNKAGATLMQNAGSIGTFASYAGGALAGYGIGTAISGKYAAFGNANVSTVAGTAIGAILGGPIGAAIGGAIGGLINRAFGRGPKEVQDYGISGSFGSMGASVRQFSNWKQDGGWFRSDKSGTDFASVSSELQLLLDLSLRTTSATVKQYISLLGMSADAVDGFSKEIKVSLKGLTEAEQEQAIATALSDFGDSMVSTLYPAVLQFQRTGETAGETLSRLATSLQTVNSVFDALGLRLIDTSLAGGDAASALIDLFGSMDAFVQMTDFYYQNFYSEGERTAYTVQQLTEAFAQLGLTLPGTREGFRELVDSARDANDKELFASLLKLAPTFASVTSELQSTAQRAAEIEAQMREEQQRAQAIASERASLERQLLELQGDYASLQEIERSSISEATRQIYDRIQALKAEQEASRNAAEAERLLAEERNRINDEAYALQGRLLQLQGDTIALRAREMAEIDEANRHILERIYALEDEQKAYEEAQRATDAAFDAVQRAITAAAQAAERSITAAYEALRQSLKTQLESARAARDVADESLNSLRSIFDLLKEQIADLRGEASAGMTPGQGLAFIDQAIATARATGYMPEQGPLSEAIAAARSGLRAENYATSFELRRDRLMLAGKLGDLQTLVGEQMTVAERQLAVAEEQLASLESRIEQARVQYEEELARNQAYYDQMLLNAQTQINELRGINQSVMGVSAAMAGLASAIGAEMAARAAAQASSPAARDPIVAGPTPAGGAMLEAAKALYYSTHGGYSTPLFDAAVAPFGGAQEAFAALGWDGSRESAAAIKAQYGFAAGGLHDGGFRIVGERGPEVEVTGPARYYSASDTAEMLGGGKAVAEELRGLREENRAQARALVQLQSRMTRLLERWDGDGLPEERVVAA